MSNKFVAKSDMSPDEAKAIIGKLGLTQQQTAYLLGVAHRSVQNWATVNVPPLAETILRLLDARPELVGAIRDLMKRPFVRPRPAHRPRRDDEENV